MGNDLSENGQGTADEERRQGAGGSGGGIPALPESLCRRQLDSHFARRTASTGELDSSAEGREAGGGIGKLDATRMSSGSMQHNNGKLIILTVAIRHPKPAP